MASQQRDRRGPEGAPTAARPDGGVRGGGRNFVTANMHCTSCTSTVSCSLTGGILAQHFLLPEDRVVLMTNRGVLLVVAPTFAALHSRAESGTQTKVGLQLLQNATNRMCMIKCTKQAMKSRSTALCLACAAARAHIVWWRCEQRHIACAAGGPAVDIREVPASNLRWEVGWQDLLVMEPRMSSSAAVSGMPDRLVVHRKGRPGVDDPAPLTHELRIFPNTPQVTPRLLWDVSGEHSCTRNAA